MVNVALLELSGRGERCQPGHFHNPGTSGRRDSERFWQTTCSCLTPDEETPWTAIAKAANAFASSPHLRATAETVRYSRSQNSGRTDQRAFSRHCVVSDFEGSLAKPWTHRYVTLEPMEKLCWSLESSGGSAPGSWGSGPQFPATKQRDSGGSCCLREQPGRAQGRGQTNSHRYRHTDGYRHRDTDTRTDTGTDRHGYRQTDRQTDTTSFLYFLRN